VDVTQQFNRRNGLDIIARAHQLVMGGFQWDHDNNIVTIFSAPNYCYRCGNKAAILQLEGSDYRYDTFTQAPEEAREESISDAVDYFL
jgi:hypothetical protein